ncbi:MAG: hypothetical protein WBA46_00670 [Thermomicrobiales bacterium]
MGGILERGWEAGATLHGGRKRCCLDCSGMVVVVTPWIVSLSRDPESAGTIAAI